MKNLKVAIGIIFKDSTVLLARRTKNTFKAGFWEFVGGKVEEDETSVQALVRECKEEIDIEVVETTFLRTLIHHYSEKTVSLDVFIITKYHGEPNSNEGQELAWVALEKVQNYHLLPTVMPLLNAAILPNIYWITPDEKYSEQWLATIQERINLGVRLIQLRLKRNVSQEVIKKVYDLCKAHDVMLMLNTPNRAEYVNYCDGFHITSNELHNATEKSHSVMSASTHTLAQAKKAEALGLDFIVISPVQETTSHPSAQPLGFEKAGEIAKNVNIPVYFLGGMSREDIEQTTKLGGQGIAGISLI